MPTVRIYNDTQVPLHITLKQLSPLHYQNSVPPNGGLATLRAGAVWFTIEARIDRGDNAYNRWNTFVPIAAVTVGALSLGAGAIYIAGASAAAGGTSAAIAAISAKIGTHVATHAPTVRRLYKYAQHGQRVVQVGQVIGIGGGATAAKMGWKGKGAQDETGEVEAEQGGAKDKKSAKKAEKGARKVLKGLLEGSVLSSPGWYMKHDRVLRICGGPRASEVEGLLVIETDTLEPFTVIDEVGNTVATSEAGLEETQQDLGSHPKDDDKIGSPVLRRTASEPARDENAALGSKPRSQPQPQHTTLANQGRSKSANVQGYPDSDSDASIITYLDLPSTSAQPAQRRSEEALRTQGPPGAGTGTGTDASKTKTKTPVVGSWLARLRGTRTSGGGASDSQANNTVSDPASSQDHAGALKPPTLPVRTYKQTSADSFRAPSPSGSPFPGTPSPSSRLPNSNPSPNPSPLVASSPAPTPTPHVVGGEDIEKPHWTLRAKATADKYGASKALGLVGGHVGERGQKWLSADGEASSAVTTTAGNAGGKDGKAKK